MVQTIFVLRIQYNLNILLKQAEPEKNRRESLYILGHY